MTNLDDSFEEVSDWCERHLEDGRGREIGMTFGAVIRAYGRMAALPDDADDEERRPLNDRAEELLLELSKRFLVSYGWVEDKSRRLATIDSQPTNMMYDPGEKQ